MRLQWFNKERLESFEQSSSRLWMAYNTGWAFEGVRSKIRQHSMRHTVLDIANIMPLASQEWLPAFLFFPPSWIPKTFHGSCSSLLINFQDFIRLTNTPFKHNLPFMQPVELYLGRQLSIQTQSKWSCFHRAVAWLIARGKQTQSQLYT